jgi:hypothetical protein
MKDGRNGARERLYPVDAFGPNRMISDLQDND